MVDKTNTLNRDLDWREGIRPALAGWLAARLAVLLGFLVAHGLSGSVNMPDGRLHLDQGLMTWDGTYYRDLADAWYLAAGVPGDAVRFFPLFPLLGKVFSFGGAVSVDIPLLLIANSSALAAALVVWQLIADHTGDRRLANRGAWIASLIPAANVYAFAYTEPLMMLVTTGALLMLARRKLGWTTLLGFLAALLRPSGLLFVVPVALAAIGELRGEQAEPSGRGEPPARPAPLSWLAPVLAPVVGVVTALLWIERSSNDLLAPVRIQGELRDGFRDPVTRIGQALWDIVSGRHHDIYNVAFALLFLALIVVAWRRRQPWPWLGFMIATWVVAVGGNNMDSVGRYCVIAAPFTVALAQWADRRWRAGTVAALGLAGTVWFTTEVMLGRIIP